jgi:hypothetical protein
MIFLVKQIVCTKSDNLQGAIQHRMRQNGEMKQNYRLRIVQITTLIAALGLFPAFSSAEDGVMSISIDRTAVSGLIRAGLPKTRTIRVPGLGEIQLHLTPPQQVSFDDGMIQARIGYRLSPSGLTGALVTSYAVLPGKDGSLQLSATSVVPEGKFTLPVDLAPFLPVVDLPAQFQWVTGNEPESLIDITAALHQIRILPDRLVIRLGLTSRRYKGHE